MALLPWLALFPSPSVPPDRQHICCSGNSSLVNSRLQSLGNPGGTLKAQIDGGTQKRLANGNLFLCPSLNMAGPDVDTATKEAATPLHSLSLRGKALVHSSSQASWR